jgi:hypothetical protein
VYPALGTVEFTAELLASWGEAGPVEFFVGTNSVGLVDQGGLLAADTAPVTVTLTNLSEGIYPFTVRYRGVGGMDCACFLKTNTIRVVQVGLRQPSVNPDGGLGFEVVTAFPGKPLLIQSSEDFVSWFNAGALPLTNVFGFGGPPIGTNSRRFYRAVALP